MECCLTQGEVIRLDGGKNGVILRCTGGVLWLTCGDGRDYLLAAGKSFAIAPYQIAVVEALHASECALAKPLAGRAHMARPIIRLATC